MDDTVEASMSEPAPPRAADPFWGAFIVAEHPGSPAFSLHDNLRGMFGEAIVDAIFCVFSGMDVLKVKATRERVQEILDVIADEDVPYGGQETYANLLDIHTAAGRAHVLKVFPLGAPEDGPLAKTAGEGRTVFVLVHLRRITGGGADVRNAKVLLKKRLQGRLVRIHPVLGERPSLLLELTFGNDLKEMDHLVARMLPELAVVEHSTTYISIRFRQDADDADSWETRLHNYFLSQDVGPEHAQNTTTIAKALGTSGGVIHRRLMDLKATGFLGSRKSRGIHSWWRI